MSFVPGKVALVTGGASGIGFAIAESLLINGAKGVTIIDMHQENGMTAVSLLETNFKDKVQFVKADVSNKNEFEMAFNKAIEKFKNLDIVVNNAGIMDENDWNKTVDINLGGVVRGTQLAFEKFLPKFKTSEEGVIVNISSVAGVEAVPFCKSYCTTKHGVVGLGRAMDDDKVYEKSKVRVLTLCPTCIQTPLLDRTFEEMQLHLNVASDLVEIIAAPDYVGESLVKLINSGQRGVWVLENGEAPYKLKFPSRKEMAVKNHE